MSVAWKTLTTTPTCGCGRLHAHQGCGSETRMSPRQQRPTKDVKTDFWSHDHYGLMSRFQEESR